MSNRFMAELDFFGDRHFHEVTWMYFDVRGITPVFEIRMCESWF